MANPFAYFVNQSIGTVWVFLNAVLFLLSSIYGILVQVHAAHAFPTQRKQTIIIQFQCLCTTTATQFKQSLIFQSSFTWTIQWHSWTPYYVQQCAPFRKQYVFCIPLQRFSWRRKLCQRSQCCSKLGTRVRHLWRHCSMESRWNVPIRYHGRHSRVETRANTRDRRKQPKPKDLIREQQHQPRRGNLLWWAKKSKLVKFQTPVVWS